MYNNRNYNTSTKQKRHQPQNYSWLSTLILLQPFFIVWASQVIEVEWMRLGVKAPWTLDSRGKVSNNLRFSPGSIVPNERLGGKNNPSFQNRVRRGGSLKEIHSHSTILLGLEGANHWVGSPIRRSPPTYWLPGVDIHSEVIRELGRLCHIDHKALRRSI